MIRLNKICNPVNIFWKVRQEENFEDKSWDKDNDGKLNVSGSKWYTNYTEEMAALKDAYQQSHSISNTEMYLFLLKQGKTDEENGYVLGDMPRGKQFGFLFMESMSNEQQLLKTIAHELGHGYFQLKHPFELGLEKEKTSLLMDYGYLPVGMQLNKYEWDLMHDPGIVTGLFQSDTSGMMLNEENLSLIHKDLIKYCKKWDNLDIRTIEWTTTDILKWKTIGNNEYLFKRKGEFIHHYKDVIEDAAFFYKIPVFLLAGIAFTEFGGDPNFIDDIAYTVRTVNWSGPEWIDENLTITNHPDKTSFGNLSIQVRVALEELGYNIKTVSYSQKYAIIYALKNPIQNIYIAAKHLYKLSQRDFKDIKELDENAIKIIATRYNRGAGLSIEKIKENLSYGNSLYKHKKEIDDNLK